MSSRIVTDVSVQTTRYDLIASESGKKKLDMREENIKEEKLVFMFDPSALEFIISRDGPSVLVIDKDGLDEKKLYFIYKDNKLTSMHLLDSAHAYIIKDIKAFLDRCRKIYVAQKLALQIMDTMTEYSGVMKEPSDYLDEFEVEDL